MQAINKETHGELAVLNWSTLSDHRAANVKKNNGLYRLALIITGKCNFACPYCKLVGGNTVPDMTRNDAINLVKSTIKLGLKELRISGGEPTIVFWLPELVRIASGEGVRVSVSSNGYSKPSVYETLVEAGVSEFSISLDTTNPETANVQSGGRMDVLSHVSNTIQLIVSLGAKVYVGMTCTSNKPVEDMKSVAMFALTRGATDIKIMSLAQEGHIVDTSWVDEKLSNQFPLLKWRSENFQHGRDVRGLHCVDCHACALALDDATVAGDSHYPCNVYFREGGEPIGRVDNDMMKERAEWFENHNSYFDPICKTFCMDILRAYNNRVSDLNPGVFE